MEATTNYSPVLDRERKRRKRIPRREYVFEFSTNLNREKQLDNNIDRAIVELKKETDKAIVELRQQNNDRAEESKRIIKELFPEPYKDWRTNEIIE